MKTVAVKSLTKTYGGKKAIDDLNFTIEAGHIVGLLGPNGAGKTTTMSIITGILAPNAGQVLFDDQPLSASNELEIKQKIGFLSESNPLYTDMLVNEYLHFMASLRGMEKDKRKEAIQRVAKETGIEDKLNQPIEELSKGYKQRVGLAQAIIHQPEILVLDEPTEGLDPNQRVTIRDLISTLGKDRTVIISTHVLSEVQAMCDRVIILNEGKIVTSGSVSEILAQGQQTQKVTFEVSGLTDSGALVGDFKIVSETNKDNHRVFQLLANGDQDIRPRLFQLAKNHNWTIYELHQESASLEDIFRSLTIGN